QHARPRSPGRGERARRRPAGRRRSADQLHRGHAALPRPRAAVGLHPRRDPGGQRCRRGRAAGDQPRQLPPAPRAGAPRSPQFHERQVRAGRSGQSVPLREEDPRLHPGRVRRSEQAAVRPCAHHARARRRSPDGQSAHRPRRAVRTRLSRASLLRGAGHRAGAATPHRERGVPAGDRPAVTATMSLVAVVCALTFVHFTAAQMRGPLVPLYAVAHGATATGVGFIVAAHMAVAALASIPLGRASDVWGRRTLLLAGMATSAVTSLLLTLVEGEVALAVIYGLAGLGVAAFTPRAWSSRSFHCSARRGASPRRPSDSSSWFWASRTPPRVSRPDG